MSFRNVFGVDLGTNSVKIYSLKKNKIKVEMNMIAVRDKEQVLAVGNDAFEMYEKAPENVEVSYPMSFGKIANLDHVEVVLHTLLYEMDKRVGNGPVIYFSVPMNMTEIERRAYYALAQAGSVRQSKVFLVERAICDAIALGIPLIRTKGSMIINIGSQCTEVSILAHEQVIISKTIPIGGGQLTEAICENVRKNCNLLIGFRTAERLKLAMGNMKNDKKEARKVYGIDTLSGLPKEEIIPSNLINEAIEQKMGELALELKLFIERIPPQIGKSVMSEGIYLTGGTTKLAGIERYISNVTGYPVKVPNYYDLCTVRGLEELITHKTLHRWAYSIKEKR